MSFPWRFRDFTAVLFRLYQVSILCQFYSELRISDFHRRSVNLHHNPKFYFSHHRKPMPSLIFGIQSVVRRHGVSEPGILRVPVFLLRVSYRMECFAAVGLHGRTHASGPRRTGSPALLSTEGSALVRARDTGDVMTTTISA